MTVTWFLPIAVFIVLSGCSSESGAEKTVTNDRGVNSNAPTSPPQQSSSHKWEINVDGLPAQTGRVITGSTKNGFGNYSLANSSATASIRLAEDNPAGSITIKYKEDNIICANFGDATTLVKDNRAMLSGSVGCYAKDENPGNQKPSAIEGWFELKK